MTITHLVLVEFEPSLSQSAIDEVCRRLLDLQNRCVKNGTGEKYIVSIKGGKNCSIEDAKASYTHGFVIEFATDEDRVYYVREDPAHLAFVESLQGLVRDVGVVDFVPGAF